MTTLDLSNHDAATFDPVCLKAAGVTRVILGCWDFVIAETMLLALRRQGITVEDLYCFLYYRLPWENNDVLNAQELARRHGGITRIWLDCEAMFDGPAGMLDTEAEGTVPVQRSTITARYFDQFTVAGFEVGIYTGLYWWRDKMANSNYFAANGAPLWLANYGTNDPDNPRPPITEVDFGGWTSPAVHQYSSTIPVCGRGRDHNYWFLEDDMGMSDNDILAVFGSTERYPKGHPQAGELDPVARLAAAKARYQAAIDTGHSPFDVASQAIAEAQAKVGKLPAGTKFKAEVTE